MAILTYISVAIIPFIILITLSYGYIKGIDVLEVFKEGVLEGAHTVVSLMPTLIGLFLAVSIFSESGALDLIAIIFEKIVEPFGYPGELVPLTLMRLVSSAASTSLLFDIFEKFGPDSYNGRLASVMMSCTETIFYTMSIYFVTAKISKSRYTLVGALIANLAGVMASVYIVNRLWG